jgi:hypothetical protein
MTQLLTVLRVLMTLILPALALASSTAHAQEPRPAMRETFFAEGGIGVSQQSEDPYTRRLEDFRFEADDWFGGATNSESVGYMLTENFGLLVRHDLLESRTYSRSLIDERSDHYAWETHAVSLGARARKPLHNEWFALYAQANLGLGFARTRYQNYHQSLVRERDFGVSFAVLVGLDVNFFKYGGLYTEAGYNITPILKNDFGDAHNDGGASWIIGLRMRVLEDK